MATDPSEDNGARLQRLEDALRRESRRFTIAVRLLTISLLLLGAVALTPFGPWVQSRLPWAMNPRFETVSANQFIVVDSNKRRAVFGVHLPKSDLKYHSFSPAPELAALWFYDDLPDFPGEPREYRAIIGLKKDTSPDAASDKFPRYQPFMRFTIFTPGGHVEYRQWP